MAYIVSYSHMTRATVPARSWDAAWFSLTTWKGYLQSAPGGDVVRVSSRPLENGDILVYVFTVWTAPEHLEEWAGSEWTAKRLLAGLQPPAYDITEEVLEDLS